MGDTPLHSAAWRGHSDVVEMLLENGNIFFTYIIKFNDAKL